MPPEPGDDRALSDAATRRTFDGRALAVIRPTGPGTITVTASAAGAAQAVVTLEVQP